MRSDKKIIPSFLIFFLLYLKLETKATQHETHLFTRNIYSKIKNQIKSRNKLH